MEVSLAALQQQNIDKQRIVVTGSEKAQLANLIIYVLKQNNRKFDHFANVNLTGQSGAPIIIVETDENLLSFHHHVAVLTPTTSLVAAQLSPFADATPKAGTIIYPEENATLKAIGSKERADVQAIPYKTIPHKIKDGVTILISSTNEEFPIKLKGEQTLLLLAAAKELLKKIGISSGQFYRAVASMS